MLVSFSGGVDSSVVAKLARMASRGSAAVTVADQTLPKSELENAKKIAREIGITHVVVNSDCMEKKFSRNDALRCYYCKKNRAKTLRGVARKLRIKTIADGINADDKNDARPGLRAAKEGGVYSPLLEEGIGKKDARALARYFHLPNYDKPAAACLASRIPHGKTITNNALRRIERAEDAVKKITRAVLVRVREHDGIARIEVGQDEMKKFFNAKRMRNIARELKRIGYKFVVLDMEGYKVGGGL